MDELNNKVIEETVLRYLDGEISDYNFKLFWRIVCKTNDFEPEQSTALWWRTVRKVRNLGEGQQELAL